MAIVIKVWYLQFDKDAVWQKMVNFCRKLAAFRQKNQANLMFCAHLHYLCRRKVRFMGRNKYSQAEISQIGKLLRLKNAGNRLQQKQIRHDLRVDYEFNISDFNEPGKAFGEQELQGAIKRGAIVILDDATIEAMKAKRARDKARDEAEREQQAIAEGEQTDWKEAMKQWEEYYK